jgi:hypothetical protein
MDARQNIDPNNSGSEGNAGGGAKVSGQNGRGASTINLQGRQADLQANDNGQRESGKHDPPGG